MKMSISLKYYDSIHEQREYLDRVIPVKDSWLELGSFTPVIERFDIRERWQVADVLQEGDGDNSTLVLDLHRRDLDKEKANSLIIIDRILAKHGDVLVGSLRYMLINGLHNRWCHISPKHDEKWLKRNKCDVKNKLDFSEDKDVFLHDAKIKVVKERRDKYLHRAELLNARIAKMEGEKNGFAGEEVVKGRFEEEGIIGRAD
jgi:hypothetical protein